MSDKDKKILADFVSFCSMTAGPGKLKDYYRYMLQIQDVLEKPLDSITKKDAIAFWGVVNQAHHEANTKIIIRRTFKRFLKWYYRDLDMIEPLKNKCYTVNKMKINKSALLKPEELQLMLHRAERLRDKTLLILLYETGARPQEVRDLKWHDINWNEKEVHLYSKKKEDDRDLPIHEALKHLKRWKEEWVYPDPREEDYIFPSIRGSRYERSKPISVTYIGRVIRTLAQKADIQRRVYPYLLRHTRLTDIHKKGVKGLEHNKFAGHVAGSKQQAIYVHLDNKDMKQNVLEKVYQIQELTEKQHHRYDEEIELLKQELTKLRSDLVSFRQAIAINSTV